METPSPPYPAIDLSTPLYCQVVHTLIGLLPPPIDDTTEPRHTTHHAAIAKVAALLPVNANEADLAAQCIAARAQAEDMLRLLRQHAGNIGLVLRLNAQYGSMVRTSLSVHGRLMRVQALRQKRESIEGAANQDAWVLHVAERSMLGVADPDAAPHRPKSPEAARAPLPEAAPTADVDQTTEAHVSEDGTNSHDAALETWLTAKFPSLGAERLEGGWLHKAVREAIAELPSASPEFPASGHESPGTPNYSDDIHGETAST